MPKQAQQGGHVSRLREAGRQVGLWRHAVTHAGSKGKTLMLGGEGSNGKVRQRGQDKAGRHDKAGRAWEVRQAGQGRTGRRAGRGNAGR
jgi:hypothetical protein